MKTFVGKNFHTGRAVNLLTCSGITRRVTQAQVQETTMKRIPTKCPKCGTGWRTRPGERCGDLGKAMDRARREPGFKVRPCDGVLRRSR